jgi:hypothetical protein
MFVFVQKGFVQNFDCHDMTATYCREISKEDDTRQSFKKQCKL